MENRNETQKDVKVDIYNVVILDKSGSMESIKREAVGGYNETLQTIKAAQRQYVETQNHFVTLVTFNSEVTQTIYDRIACEEAPELTDKTYLPDCCTPLYDAMGTTLSKFRYSLNSAADNKVLVTVITDGLENASKEYTGEHIRRMVTDLKALGWVFTYIGANHDVEAFAESIAVQNALLYKSTEQGTKDMFAKERRSRMVFYEKIHCSLDNEALQKGFFDEEDESSKQS